jgi:transcriptional regulator with PAS, ATPase and Fis domain
MELIKLVAASRCNPVLIVGETGTGKELAARAVHAWRHGNQARLVAINCAALTANLLESELFGHVKGAFTGADREKVGLFELAGEGSIFLDEVSEMDLGLQAKLLRVLQERTFRRVGGTIDVACQATVIASSNRDLMQEVEAGRFRRDLYYRLAVFPIHIPPLRAQNRQSDIPLLARYFVVAASGSGLDAVHLGPQASQRLLEHDWPGNVRELKNVMERAIILRTRGEIGVSDLVFDVSQSAAQADQAALRAQAEQDCFSLETAEREFILRALKEARWQRSRAANLLGITRATLYAKLKRYGINPP